MLQHEVTESSPETRFRYFADTEPDRAWGVRATSTGFVNIAPGAAYPPAGHPDGYEFRWETGRRLDEFQLHLISRGSGIFEDDVGHDAGIPIHAGDIFVLIPGVWHRYRPTPETGWHEYWIGFKGPQAEEALQHGFIQPSRPIFNVSDSELVLNLFAEGVARIHNEDVGIARILGSLAMLILAQVHSDMETTDKQSSRKRDIIWETKIFLQQNYAQALDQEDLARLLNVGYHWLRRTFRQETGISLHQYHLQLRINRARRLLVQTDATVAEIAGRIGYDSPAYFSRLFKKKTGFTPGEWRNSVDTIAHFHTQA